MKNGPTYNCTECSCVFKSLGSLNTHISKMHMGGPQNSASASTDVSHVTAVSFADPNEMKMSESLVRSIS